MNARPAAVLLLALVLALAACGGGGGTASWPGPDRPFPADGVLPVEAFNEYAQAADAPWRRSPLLTAAGFLRLDEAEAARISVESRSSPEGGETASVTATVDGLLDDSIRAERYALELRREGDDTWRLASARWSQRCWPGRGHQAFTPEPCV